MVSLIIIPGFILCILPGIYLTVKLSLVVAFLALGGRGAGESIRLSFEKTKGHEIHIFLLYLILFSILMGVSFVLNMISSISTLAAHSAGTYASLIPAMIVQMIQSILSGAITILITIGIVGFYKHITGSDGNSSSGSAFPAANPETGGQNPYR